VLSQRI